MFVQLIYLHVYIARRLLVCFCVNAQLKREINSRDYLPVCLLVNIVFQY
jgi:hypothetical protein